VEPVVVSASHRGRGIGRTLLSHVAGEARRRGLIRLAVRSESRNVQALRCLNAAGFDILSAVELSVDLRPDGASWPEEIDIHGIRFSA
jgi:GNAT superfamily N-acetyltransferase